MYLGSSEHSLLICASLPKSLAPDTRQAQLPSHKQQRCLAAATPYHAYICLSPKSMPTHATPFLTIPPFVAHPPPLHQYRQAPLSGGMELQAAFKRTPPSSAGTTPLAMPDWESVKPEEKALVHQVGPALPHPLHVTSISCCAIP